MDNVLIFKTASDIVMTSLLKDLNYKEAKVHCLIQSGLVEVYEIKYPNIEFININKNGFYSISDEIVAKCKSIEFDDIYVPTTTLHAINFGNIIDIVKELNYKNLIFYNCNREKILIRKKSKVKEKLIILYSFIVRLIYR